MCRKEGSSKMWYINTKEHYSVAKITFSSNLMTQEDKLRGMAKCYFQVDYFLTF